MLLPRTAAICALAILLCAARARAGEPQSAAAESAPKGTPSSKAGISGEIPFDVTSDKLWYDGKTGDWILDGHVVITRQGGILHCSRARFLHDAQELYLEGPVLAIQGTEVALADSAKIDLAANATDLAAAILYVKAVAGLPANLHALEDPKLARTTGKNAATLHADRAVKRDDGTTLLGNVTLTPCDCPGRPDYEIDSPQAVVDGDRAYLSRPHIRFMGLRIPFLALALPLEDRQSGMLAPQLGYASSTGFRFGLPIYFTLGRSWDLTLTPGVFSGSPGSSHGADLASRDVRGPRLGAELRFAPIDGTRGEIGLDLMKDFAAGNSLAQDPTVAYPAPGGLYPGEHPSSSGRGSDGFRGTLRFADRSDIFGWTLVAQGQLASDAMVVADTQPLQIDRYLDDLRSDLGLFRNFGSAFTLGFDSTYLQDLRVESYAENVALNQYSNDRRLFGAEARATPTRLPSPFMQLLPQLLGPFAFSTEASIVSVTSFVSSAQEKATGFGPTDTSGGATTSVANGTDLSRAPTVRFDIAPRISAALPDDLPIRGKLTLGARADAWLFDGYPDRDAQRLQGLAGGELSMLLEKHFGSYLHTIEPQLFARAITPALLGGGAPLGDLADAGGATYSTNPLQAEQGVAPGTPPTNYTTTGAQSLLGQYVSPFTRNNALGVPALRRAIDELDESAPSTGEVETSFAIRQSLWGKPNPRGPPQRIASLVLQQDFVLWDHAGSARAADTSATASLWLPFFTMTGEARWDWHLRVFSLAQGTASLHDARTDDIHFAATAILGAAGDHIRAGVDELFAATLLAATPGEVQGTVGGGVSWSLPAWALPVEAKGSHLGYDVAFHPGTLVMGVPDMVHTISFSWTPPCGCAALTLGVDLPFRNGSLIYAPTVRFNFQLQSFGR